MFYASMIDSEHMICATEFLDSGFEDNSRGACNGDSGGPLTHVKEGKHYIAGIVSWGVHCGNIMTPSVYLNVHAHLDWISENSYDRCPEDSMLSSCLECLYFV